MPTGQPDSSRSMDPDRIESYADRLIREAMDSGEFEDLPGKGKPIPGIGTADDDGWWLRSWVERNRDPKSGSQ